MFEGDSSDHGTAVARVAAAVDVLLALDLDQLTDAELRTLLAAVERQARRLPALLHRLVALADQRQLGRRIGLRDTATLLRKDLRLSAGEARARCRAAAELGPRVDDGRGVIEPRLATTAAAQRDGEISAAHARVIHEAVERLPEAVRGEQAEAVEALLVAHACRLDPVRLAQQANHLLAELDVDRARCREAEHHRLRGLSFRLNPDGSADLRARLTPVGAAIVQAGLMPLAAPRPDDAGGPDERTPIQRGHDGLVEAFRRLLGAQEIPGEGGVPATVIVTVPLADLTAMKATATTGTATTGMVTTGTAVTGTATTGRRATGTATTQYGGELSIHELLQLAGEALVIPVVVDEHQAPLHVGRAKRFATKEQTYALIARDKGCSFPDCDHPPPWTQRHHILAWLYGGWTDIDNLTLLCRYHHANFERLGWECLVIDGVVHWRPPRSVDPRRRPIRNTAHDRPGPAAVQPSAAAA